MKLRKKILIFFLVFLIINLQSIPTHAATKDWYQVKGTYVKDDNSQYNNTVLSLMYLDNDVVMFEFFVMVGSESEDTSSDFCLSGAFHVDENGVGIYNHPKTGDTTIAFELNEGGVAIKQTGNLQFNVSGNYEFIEDYIKVTEEAATEIIEQLPPAATSLNQYNSGSKLVMSEEMVDGWFYDVSAYLDDTDQLIAKFYIAADMSAVYRVDTDVPILIWGSAQPMMDATYLIEEESIYGVTSVEELDITKDDNEAEEDNIIEADYVTVYPQNSSVEIGKSTPTMTTVPGMLAYSLSCNSSDPKIIQVDESGVVTAVSEGEAIISGVIMVDGAEKKFEYTVKSYNANPEVTNNEDKEDNTLKEYDGKENNSLNNNVDQGNDSKDENTSKTNNDVKDYTIMIWFAVAGSIIIVAVVYIVMKRRKRR